MVNLSNMSPVLPQTPVPAPIIITTNIRLPCTTGLNYILIFHFFLPLDFVVAGALEETLPALEVAAEGALLPLIDWTAFNCLF